MQEPIIVTFFHLLPEVLRWEFPLNVIAGLYFGFGALLERHLLRRGGRGFGFPLLLLALVVTCELFWQMDGTFDGLLFPLAEFLVLSILLGSLCTLIIHFIARKIKKP